jgi:tetratricopeptide (TPR) repeat protein
MELGYDDDLDLMLQCGRALFREGLLAEAREFFEVVARQVPENAEALALIGYCEHRLGHDDRAIAALERALVLDDEHSEARIYLANILYDRSAFDEALAHLDFTSPEDHWDDLGIWRFIELSAMLRRVREDDPDLKPWHDRLLELGGEPDAVDVMLEEIEQRAAQSAERSARGQLELFGAALAEHAQARAARHEVMLTDGRTLAGTWEEIVQQMHDARGRRGERTVEEFMRGEANRTAARTGVSISAADAESFIRSSADAGMLRILE